MSGKKPSHKSCRYLCELLLHGACHARAAGHDLGHLAQRCRTGLGHIRRHNQFHRLFVCLSLPNENLGRRQLHCSARAALVAQTQHCLHLRAYRDCAPEVSPLRHALLNLREVSLDESYRVVLQRVSGTFAEGSPPRWQLLTHGHQRAPLVKVRLRSKTWPCKQSRCTRQGLH